MSASELETLVAQAGVIDSESATPEPASAEPEVIKLDTAGEVTALLKTVADMLTPAFPSLAKIYTPETCQRLGDAAAPVMTKYGWTVGGFFEQWGAEIALIGAALPIGIATAQGIRADIAARKNPVPEVKKTPDPASGE